MAGVALTRNRGHQNALLCGLDEAVRHCDAAVSIDCDGQDDIAAIDEMLDAYLDGYDVVYGVRSRRDTDTAFKRLTAEGFYRLLERLGAQTVYNHADYRLLSRRAIEGLLEFRETNLYLRGLVPLVGYPSTTVSYEREARIAGNSHYPLGRMVALALDGVTSLSVTPIRFITVLGLVVGVLGIAGAVWAVVAALSGNTVAGWASTTAILCTLGGIQIACLGIVGEYVGKTYLEVKRRPRYLVRERTWAPSPRRLIEEEEGLREPSEVEG